MQQVAHHSRRRFSRLLSELMIPTAFKSDKRKGHQSFAVVSILHKTPRLPSLVSPISAGRVGVGRGWSLQCLVSSQGELWDCLIRKIKDVRHVKEGFCLFIGRFIQTAARVNAFSGGKRIWLCVTVLIRRHCHLIPSTRVVRFLLVSDFC